MFSPHRGRVVQAVAAAGFALVLLGSLSEAALASHLTCGLTQLSDTTGAVIGGEAVAISADGRRALVLSRENRAGQNPNRRLQLFLIDLDGGETVQLTRSELDGSLVEVVSASDDLRRVLLRSAEDLTGENPDRALQVFLFDTATREFHQITLGSTEFADPDFAPVMSGDGSTVAIVSRLDPVGENGDGSHEVFVFAVDSGEVRQVTNLSQVAFVNQPSLNGDGSRMAVRIRRSLSGIDEVVLYDVLSREFLRLAAASRLGNPVIDAAGARVFFVAEADPFGKNPDGGPEIFAVSVQPSPPTTIDGPIDQLTELTGVRALDGLAISRDGKRAAFRTNGNPLGGDGGGPNLFVFDVESRELTQVTFLTDGGVGPRFQLDGDGDRIVMGLSGNPLTTNPDGNREAFFAQCEQAAVYFFPQVGNGVAGNLQFRTNFVFVNTGENTTLTLEFFDSLGRSAAMDLAGLGSQPQFAFELPKGRPLLLETGGAGRLSVGYARVRAGAGVTATAVFTGGRASSKTALYEAAVALTSPVSDFTVVINTLGNFQTGLAMVNADEPESSDAAAPADVRMRLYNELFELVGEKVVTLAPGEHSAQFVDEVFFDVPAVQEMVGTMTVSSNRPLAVVTLRLHDDPRRDFPDEVPTLTTLPVAPGRADRMPPR